MCWHSPQHPKAQIGKSASELRVKLNEEGEKTRVSFQSPPSVNKPTVMEVEKDRDREKERMERPYHENRFKKPDHRDHRRRRNRDDDELDPMDPSAYSDVPR